MLLCKKWFAQLAFVHPKGYDVSVQVERNGLTFLMMSVYAPNNQAERRALWLLLYERIMDRNCILCGDFKQGDEESSEEWA